MQERAERKRYTYDDYCTWPDDERWELIDGVPYAMAPGASIHHQSISGELFTQISVYLRGKSCKVFHPPTDVVIDDKNVVQPDIFVVCDQKKIENDKCCKGAPDMVIEILSPSTRPQDMLKKFNLYLHAGVQEYWIVEPEAGVVNVYLLEGDAYKSRRAYGAEDCVPVSVLDGFSVDMRTVFPQEAPPSKAPPSEAPPSEAPPSET